VGIAVRDVVSAGELSAPAGHDRPLAIVTLIVWACTASIGAYMLRRWVLRGGLRRRPPGGAGAGGAGAGERQRGLPPGVIITHFSLALSGLLVWAAFVISGSDDLAWAAAGLLMPAIGLGICTVTLWTPYPTYPDPFGAPPPPGGAGPAGSGGTSGVVTGPAGGRLAGPTQHALAARLTDEAMARALTDDALARRLTEDVLARARPDEPERRKGSPKGHLAPLIPVAHGMGALATFLLVVLTAIGAR
jgi:hypothetical protein